MTDEESARMNAAVRDRILKLCGEKEMTINRLAELSGLAPSSIKNIIYGKSANPKLSTIKGICDGLDMTISEFFDTDDFQKRGPEGGFP